MSDTELILEEMQEATRAKKWHLFADLIMALQDAVEIELEIQEQDNDKIPKSNESGFWP